MPHLYVTVSELSTYSVIIHMIYFSAARLHI